MDDAPSLRSSSGLDDRKSPDDSQIIRELQDKFARLLEVTIESSQLSPDELARKVDHKLEQMFDNLARKPEVCLICLEPVPADTRYGLLEACHHAHCEPCLRGWLMKSRRQAPNSKTVSCPICRAVSSRALFNETVLICKCDAFEDDCEKADKLDAVLYVEHVLIDPESNSDRSITTGDSQNSGLWALGTNPTIENYVNPQSLFRRESSFERILNSPLLYDVLANWDWNRRVFDPSSDTDPNVQVPAREQDEEEAQEVEDP